ncbi:MAG TPA: M1 family metallopeptidase [Thermoanaerobaculia bacterium]|nr:M1 family metallopeptidase [Thermoanaerobaculia bacterium]HQR66795.1 M1 family metallopeptidase [Thermoanaerobaculia bacterium]
MSRIDPHSYADAAQPRLRHLDLDLDVDFDRRVISGRAVLSLDAPGSGPLDLDTKGLAICSVATEAGAAVPFGLADEEPILGRRLTLSLPPGTRRVAIRYETSPDAVALQWLDPAQTAGGTHPFLYSQCQAIHARTVVPLQDTPAFRVTYGAALTLPGALSAVMSAGPAGDRPGPRPGTRTFLFEMPQPIPSYLFALAAGRLAARDLSPRARVHAEPEVVDAAAREFAGVEEMIRTAERLFGPYPWERYDLLVLPPSFPYGGMENPRMTFLTPTVIAGDRSLVDVVAHELAHSWTGNLVTNATMDHFWLNEGATTWAERRILEALHGEPTAVLAWAIGETALKLAFERFGADSPLTKLRTDLAGVDPDDAFSSIPYEKGSRFFALLERTAGRERFDRFVADYISRFRFTSITSEAFLAFLDEKLPGISATVGAAEWLSGTGMPANSPVFRSARLEELTGLAARFADGARPDPAAVAGWTPSETLVYLQHVPRPLPHAACAELESLFSFLAQGNHELLVEGLTIAAASDWERAFGRIRDVLLSVGRMKYLRPLFKALGGHPRTRALGREIYAAARPRYHALSRRVVEAAIAAWPPEAVTP